MANMKDVLQLMSRSYKGQIKPYNFILLLCFMVMVHRKFTDKAVAKQLAPEHKLLKPAIM